MTATKVRMMPPIPLTGLLHAQWANCVLKTALELDVFSALKGPGATSQAIAQKLQLDEKATKLMFEALVAMELIVKTGETFKLTDVTEAYLVKDSDLYFGQYILTKGPLVTAWMNLSETIKTGKPQSRVNEEGTAEEFFKELTKSIFPINYTTAQELSEHLKTAAMGQAQVLDLAAGSGVWSLPMAQGNKNLKVDALDFPPVLEVTREYATKYGVAGQYEYLGGNWRDVRLKAEHYDIIILGHILHSEGKEASEELLKACGLALKTGGTLVVAEFLQNEERTGPLFPSLFAINMLLATTDGCVFTVDELKAMMVKAGMHHPQRLMLQYWKENSPVMIAKK